MRKLFKSKKSSKKALVWNRLVLIILAILGNLGLNLIVNGKNFLLESTVSTFLLINGGKKNLYEGILIKFLNTTFESYSDAWFQILYLVSVISMILGSIAAVNQSNIKRLLAYSSISHMGFILIGILTANHIGIKSVQLYISIYMLNVLGIFTCILCLKNKVDGYYLENIKNFSGLLKKNPFLSFSFAILLFSLVGIPPLSGFFGKLYILISAIESKLYVLSVIAVLTSIISAFYYLRIIKVIFFDKPINDIYINIPAIFRLIIFITLIISIFLIIFLSDFLEIINTTALINN